MLIQEIFFIIIFIQLSSATISISIYHNARFVPNNITSNIVDLFVINSPTECACKCIGNTQCLTATYIGINQTCSLFSIQFNTKFLQVTTTHMDARVFNLGNRINPSRYGFIFDCLQLFLF